MCLLWQGLWAVPLIPTLFTGDSFAGMADLILQRGLFVACLMVVLNGFDEAKTCWQRGGIDEHLHHLLSIAMTAYGMALFYSPIPLEFKATVCVMFLLFCSLEIGKELCAAP